MAQDIFSQLTGSPEAVLIMQRFQKYMENEQKKRKEFLNMVHEDHKAEFINGEIVMHSPVRMLHWKVSSRIAKALMNFVDEHDLGLVGVEKVMIKLSRNCYEPDIVFFRKELSDAFDDDQKLFPVPDLAVEILSESTRANDYGLKFRDYEAHEVGEYWIVDPDAATVEQYVLLEGKFELHHKLSQTGKITSLLVPGFQAEISTFFR